jgi:hypothetical protein
MCFGQKTFRERKDYKENIGVVAVNIKGASTELVGASMI